MTQIENKVAKHERAIKLLVNIEIAQKRAINAELELNTINITFPADYKKWKLQRIKINQQIVERLTNSYNNLIKTIWKT